VKSGKAFFRTEVMKKKKKKVLRNEGKLSVKNEKKYYGDILERNLSYRSTCF
jgi:hypothetical protein